MKDWFINLVRPDLRKMTAYRSARSEADGFSPDISIDANEFPWPPFGFASEWCRLNRYPEPQPKALLQRLAALWEIEADHMLLARGSDEGIDVLIRLFCRAGKDQILVCPPTYNMYEIAACLQGAKVLKAPLKKDGQLDLPKILKASTAYTKLIFIPSPNAPMGHLMKRKDVLALCKARAGHSLIVVDEAYIEFSDTPDGMLSELKKTPNLVILRTLSKAHALAGERVGVVIAEPELIRCLAKILAPYPLTQTGIRAALDALSTNGLIENRERRRLLVSERGRMAKLLLKSPFLDSVFPSVSNFLLAKTKDSGEVMRRLKSCGILARDRSSELPDTVRFSIGTPEENDLVLKALDVHVQKHQGSKRIFSATRTTRETSIDVTVNLDSPGSLAIDTGLGFFDHMLEQLAKHGGFGLALACKGDLHIDPHHSIEDCALALGEALSGALSGKEGIARYGFTLPMDEALAQAVLDLSGRPYFEFKGSFPASSAGDMPAEMVPHFFRSLSTALKATLHLSVQGENTHHMIEALFKVTGHALRQAFTRDGDALLTTKGVL